MLILAQAAHSTEEYVFRLFDVFAPARFVSSLVSDNLAVGFAFYQDSEDVRWLYIGLRCVACGELGVYGDWKIDYAPSKKLLDQV